MTRHNRRRRLLVALVAMVGIGVLVGASYLAWVAVRRAQPLTLPAPSGPHSVGRRAYQWVDSARLDPLSPSGSSPRALAVWVWYPADPLRAAPPATYLPDGWNTLNHGLFRQDLAAVRPHAVDGARPEASPARLPVLVLQPGMGEVALYYTSIAEDLASHGYVVAAITPTYSADATVLTGGRTVRATPAGMHVDTALLTEWAHDMSFATNELTTLDRAAAGPFTGRLALDHVGFLGHSFGGAAAVQACASDTRCGGAADLDGELWGPVLSTGLSRPVLLLGDDGSCVAGPRGSASGQNPECTAHSARFLAHQHRDTYVYTITDTQHLNFSDLGVWFFAPPFRQLLGVAGPIPGDTALRITNAYLTAFFAHALLHQQATLLTNPSPAYPQARYVTVEPP